MAEVTGLLLLLPGFLTISQQFPPQVGSLEWLEWLHTNSAVMLASGGNWSHESASKEFIASGIKGDQVNDGCYYAAA